LLEISCFGPILILLSFTTIVALLQRGTLQTCCGIDDSLDAAFTIPAAGGFPILPAGQAPDGTLKLAMDCEGLILNKDGSFWISDEYGRTSHCNLTNPSKRIPFLTRGYPSQSHHSPSRIRSHAQWRQIILRQ
jgi:hypothetical protein